MAKIFTTEIGQAKGPCVVFGHGWARSHTDFVAIAELIAHRARCVLLDFPGFGESPRPEAAWDTSDYARAVQAHLAEALNIQHFTWVGHSFGGRVGLRLAAQEQSPVDRLFLIAAAGLPRERSPLEQAKGKLRSWQFQRKKAAAITEEALADLEKQFGSADYVQSRALGLRDIFLKTIAEDQSPHLPRITCPTQLFYGGKDGETPPEIGRKIAALIPGASYLEAPEFGHLTLLTRGRHQIASMILDGLGHQAEAAA